MIRAVANFFAAAISILIIVAFGAIVFGIHTAIGANTDQEVLYIGTAIAISGVLVLLSLGMACVLLDIMFTVRKISEDRNPKPNIASKSAPRTEPEL